MLSVNEMLQQYRQSGMVSGTVTVDLEDLIEAAAHNGLDGVFDLMSWALTGSEALADLNFTVIGVDPTVPSRLILSVEGDPSLFLDDVGDREEE